MNMSAKITATLAALLAGATMFSSRAVFAHDCYNAGSLNAVSTPRGTAMKGWIDLHRPDGETVRMKASQIIFIMTTTGTGASARAKSKLQLMNGFIDVRESIEEVMWIIQSDESDNKRASSQNGDACPNSAS
jgi:hypothetical protein